MYKCPFPGCDYVGQYAILNTHAETHGFKTVKEMTNVHGKVIMLKYDTKRLNQAHRAPTVTSSSFNNIESAVSRMKNTDRSDLRVRK